MLCGKWCDEPVWCSIYNGNQAACVGAYIPRDPPGYSRCEWRGGGKGGPGSCVASKEVFDCPWPPSPPTLEPPSPPSPPPSPSSPPPSPSSPCADTKKAKYCQKKLDQGKCRSNTKVQLKCQLTCDTCGVTLCAEDRKKQKVCDRLEKRCGLMTTKGAKARVKCAKTCAAVNEECLAS